MKEYFTIAEERTSILHGLEQFCSNLLNVNKITSLLENGIYTAELDILEPSLLEVELAIEKFKEKTLKLPE